MHSPLPANPFLRNNPFYVPQKFYSQSNSAPKSINYSSENIPSSYNFRSNPRIFMEKYSDITKSSGLLAKASQPNERVEKLVKKGFNSRQSPFMRKTLLQNNFMKDQQNLRKVQYHGLATPKDHMWTYKQNQSKQNKKEAHVVIQSPKVTARPEKAEITSAVKQKYFSSELKIKLKSQTYIEDQPPESMGEQPKKSIQKLRSYPSKLKWRGKVFVLRQLV